MSYLVKEIFGPTIQGEGRWTGLPCVFLRLSNCNKWSGRPEDKAKSICNYCDTDFVGGERLSADEIYSRIYGTSDAVTITGGEPMLQLAKDPSILGKLKDMHIMIETNGSIPFHWLNVPGLSVTISPKQSAKETWYPSFGFDLKFLYPWIAPDIHPLAFGANRYLERIYIQPIDLPGGINSTQKAFEEVVRLRALGLPAFLSQQTHKLGGFR